MEFCSMCSTSFDSDGDRRIRCSGQQCKLDFHQRCVHLTEAHVRSWLDEDVGLFWFCPTCRVDLAPGTSSSQKHKIDEEDGERQRKKIRLDPAIRLPPEIWLMVFEYLEKRGLARVRLVCRDWDKLVCARTELMDRFLLKLNSTDFVDDLALSKGFTRAEFSLSRAKDRPRTEWFYTLGETLTTLTWSSTPFGYLCQILRAFPKLKRLTLTYCFQNGKTTKLNYQLNNLEELTIGGFNNKTYGASIFSTLEHICPKITVLKLGGDSYHQFTKQIESFLSAIQDTLVELSLHASREMVQYLIKADHLCLKRISIHCTEHDLLRLLRRLPSLKHLHFRDRLTNVSIFEEIPRILPNLTTLELDKVALAATSTPTPLNLTRAELIRIRYEAAPVYVSGLSFCESSSLQRLEISGAYLPSDALASLAQIATRIKNVTFSRCTVQRVSDILTFVQQSTSLTTFEINWLTVKSTNDMPVSANGQSNIHHLKLNFNSRNLLAALAKLCPKLESLHIMNRVSERDMSRMGRQLTHLKSLTLSWYEETHECLRQIPNGFKALENLLITGCRVPKEDVQEALEGLRKDVEVTFEFWHPYYGESPPLPVGYRKL